MFVKETAKNSTVFKIVLKAKTTKLFWAVSFSILTFAGAQVIIPTQPVPFTLQTMMVLLTGAFLGSKNGALSQFIYLAAGIIGLPVFAGFDFGFAKLIGPTGGYLLSFPLAAFITGYILERKNNTFSIIFSFVLSNALILFAGALYLSIFFNGDFSKSFFAGAVIFSAWDIFKLAAAVSIYKAFAKKYPKLPA